MDFIRQQTIGKSSNTVDVPEIILLKRLNDSLGFFWFVPLLQQNFHFSDISEQQC